MIALVQALEAAEMKRMTDAALATPKGQKKDFSSEMPKTYDPIYVEAALCAPPPSHCAALTQACTRLCFLPE